MIIKDIDKSSTLVKYKETMADILQLYLPQGIKRDDMYQIIDYSINKRYYESNCRLENSYTNKNYNSTLLKMADYIMDRQPIVTAFGTMFMKHAEVPNPMGKVIQDFLDLRGIHKKQMFTFPKGSENFEKYNLLQQLDKIDCNGIYGCLGMYTSLLFNINVSTSVTSQGRALISSASLFFESFLANNVKFGSVDEVLEFINNVCKESRSYRDEDFIDKPISIEDCFAKVILSCGYRWYPDDEEMDIIWRVINNLGQRDLNRIYYKNNLYEFMSNSSMKRAIKIIMKKLKNPFFNSLKVPKEIESELQELASILGEFVFYNKMYIDRIDRCDNMIKSTIMVSDTDSCIVSLDAWYRFALDIIKDEELQIKKYDPISVIKFFEVDEFGDPENLSDLAPIHFDEPDEHYDFINDDIIFTDHAINPLRFMPQDYLRYSIMNIMAYIIDVLLNKYMEQFTINNHSYDPSRKCKILMKNEFSFLRLLMTTVKKNYASIMGIQEGNVIPEDEQLDIKGIACMAKSSTAKSTRNELKKILLEDILKAPTIDQFKVVEQLAILEKKIIRAIWDGSKEFYKPLTIKSQDNYQDPMRNQGIKASVVWNSIKTDELPGIDLNERNAIDVAKVNINSKNLDDLQGKIPEEILVKLKGIINNNIFKGKIDCIALPLEVQPPEWLLEVIDYKSIVNDNISGFVYDSIGVVNLDPEHNRTNYSNIIQL